jgi:hypothetical protein
MLIIDPLLLLTGEPGKGFRKKIFFLPGTGELGILGSVTTDIQGIQNLF